MTKMYALTSGWPTDPDPQLLETITNEKHVKIRPGNVLMYKGNKSVSFFSQSFGEATLPTASFAPPLITFFSHWPRKCKPRYCFRPYGNTESFFAQQ